MCDELEWASAPLKRIRAADKLDCQTAGLQVLVMPPCHKPPQSCRDLYQFTLKVCWTSLVLKVRRQGAFLALCSRNADLTLGVCYRYLWWISPSQMPKQHSQCGMLVRNTGSSTVSVPTCVQSSAITQDLVQWLLLPRPMHCPGRGALILRVPCHAAVASHGMSQALIERQFAASKAFFALPLSTKLKLKVGKCLH